MQNISINSTLGPKVQSYDAFLNSLNSQIVYYFVIVSAVFGIPGNLISMIVFVRLAFKNRKINMGLLYTCQTAIDLIMQILSLLALRGAIYLFGVNIFTLSDSFCRGFMFMRRFILQASSWMSVFISFDRFTFVLYEHRFKFMKNKLILSGLIFAVMFLVALSDVENFFYYLTWSNKTSSYSCLASNSVTVASDIISMLVRIYIPLLLMVVFNGLMIYWIFKKSRSSKVVVQKNSALKRKEHQFTISVLSCNALFFLTNFPLAIFFIFYDSLLYSNAFKSDSILSARYSLYMNILVSISFFDQTFSIFMYFGFNKLFRKELIFIIFKIFPFKVFRNLYFDGMTRDMTNNNLASLSGRN